MKIIKIEKVYQKKLLKKIIKVMLRIKKKDKIVRQEKQDPTQELEIQIIQFNYLSEKQKKLMKNL